MTKCVPVLCDEFAWAFVSWPGQPISLCRTCTTRALALADHMGFVLPVFVFDGSELPAVD